MPDVPSGSTVFAVTTPGGAPVDRQLSAAVEAVSLGASVIRVDSGAAVSALRGETGAIIQLALDRPELAVALDSEPDLVAVPVSGLTAGVYGELVTRRPIAVFDVRSFDDLNTLRRLLAQHGPPTLGLLHVCLAMGAPGAIPGTLPAMAAALELLPDGAVWSASGAGSARMPVMLAALAAGGQIRVDADDQAGVSTQVVARAIGLARVAQRPPMSIVDAREFLGLGDPVVMSA